MKIITKHFLQLAVDKSFCETKFTMLLTCTVDKKFGGRCVPKFDTAITTRVEFSPGTGGLSVKTRQVHRTQGNCFGKDFGQLMKFSARWQIFQQGGKHHLVLRQLA